MDKKKNECPEVEKDGWNHQLTWHCWSDGIWSSKHQWIAHNLLHPLVYTFKQFFFLPFFKRMIIKKIKVVKKMKQKKRSGFYLLFNVSIRGKEFEQIITASQSRNVPHYQISVKKHIFVNSILGKQEKREKKARKRPWFVTDSVNTNHRGMRRRRAVSVSRRHGISWFGFVDMLMRLRCLTPENTTEK